MLEEKKNNYIIITVFETTYQDKSTKKKPRKYKK